MFINLYDPEEEEESGSEEETPNPDSLPVEDEHMDVSSDDKQPASDPELVKDEPHKDPCQALIQEIRKKEFGIDVVLSTDGQELMAKQQERLGRSLYRLSKDLYSKDTHFVLELIQNADDNDYPGDIVR